MYKHKGNGYHIDHIAIPSLAETFLEAWSGSDKLGNISQEKLTI